MWLMHVLSIVIYLRQNSFFVTLKQWQTTVWIFNTLFLIDCERRGNHFEHCFLIDKCSCKMVNTLSFDISNSYAISSNFNLRSAKMSLWSFFGIFRANYRLTWQFNIICVCTTAFKVSIPHLNRWFWRSKVRITLIKPLLGSNSIFPIRKQCFIHTRNSDFSLF